ncbi:MAG: hypothetical protein Kow0089_25080 [Desulfobulbaceae bacterium]
MLIVEDDAQMRDFMLRTLELHDIPCLAAATGAEAVEKARGGDISLMTIDYSLPDMTGDELVRTLRSQGIDIPFIMITGMGDEEVAVRSMKLGARDYLVKNDNLFDRVPRVVTEILDLLRTEEEVRRVRAALSESEARFSVIFQNASDGFVLVDEEGRILDINRQGKLMLGYGPDDEPAGALLTDFLEEKDAGRLLDDDPGHPLYRYEMTVRSRDGKTFPADVVTSRFSLQGRPCLLLDFRDLSEQSKLLAAIRGGVEEWQVTFDAITDLVSVHDREMRILKVNRAFADFVELSFEEIVGRQCSDILHPGGFSFDVCPHRETVAEGKVVTRELDLPEQGISFLVTTSPIFDGEGKVGGAVHVAKDVTPLKQVVDDLKQQEDFLSSILDSIHDGISVLTPELRILRVNRFLEEKFAAQAPLAGKRCYEIYRQRDEPCEECPTRRTLDTGRPSSEILSFPVPGRGPCCWMEVFTYPVLQQGRDGSPEVACVIEYMKDVTERRRAEAELRQSEERYRLLFENAVDAMVVAQRESGIVTEFNRAAEELFNLQSEEVAGRPLQDIFPGEDVFEELRRIVAGQLERRDGNADELALSLGGGQRDIHVRADTISYGEEPHLLLVLRDVTSQKEMGERMKQAQKLEAIGTLAAGIAHDFNNILSAILGFADIVKTDLEAGNPVQVEDIEGIAEAGRRAAELIRQVLVFSRETATEKRDLNLVPVVKETVKFLKASLPSTIEVVEELDTVVRPVKADPVQMHQVVMNLCTNAFHAMRKNGGRLTVSLAERKVPTEVAVAGENVRPGDHVCLTVRDTGHGMDDLTLSLMFDPFFTTKEQGEGTGLGLSVVHGIVQEHGGVIDVESEVGKGTTFRVYLPVAEGSEEDRRAENEEELPSGVGERILLVDDEKMVVETSKRMLERLGYEVEGCTDSEQCLEMFSTAPARYDLVISDLTMPKLTGLDLAREIKKLSPRTPVILMTGFAAGLSDEDLSEHLIEDMVRKPVLKKEIARAVRAALDGGISKTRRHP